MRLNVERLEPKLVKCMLPERIHCVNTLQDISVSGIPLKRHGEGLERAK